MICRTNACIDKALNEITPAPEIVDFRFPELMIAGAKETSLPIPAYIKAFRRLKAMVEHHQPALLYCSGGLPCQLAIPVGRLLKIPVLCHFHHPAMRRAIYLWLVRFADRLLFPSTFVQRHTSRDLSDPGAVVYNGIDLARFQPAKARVDDWRMKWGIPANAAVIGQVGALSAHKRPDLLISILGSVIAVSKRPVHLCLVGAGPMEERLRRLANDVGVGPHVTVTGYVDDVLPYYQHVFDINVLVSLEEGLGISVLEGSACGLPAVVSNCTGLPETIIANRTGFHFEVNDQEELCRHLVSLIDQPALRATMGRAGVDFTAERFSSVSYAEKLMASVRDVLAGREAPDVLARDDRPG